MCDSQLIIWHSVTAAYEHTRWRGNQLPTVVWQWLSWS